MGWFLVLIGLAGIGAVVIVYGLGNPEAGIGKLVYKYWPFPQPEWAYQRQHQRERAATKRLREAAVEPEPEEKLRQANVGAFMTDIMGRNIQFVGKMLLLELQYFGSDKSKKVHVSPAGETLREFQAYVLSGNRILLEQPVGEGQNLSWFLYNEVTGQAPGFTEYLKGDEQNPGPGVVFANSKQSKEVVVDLVNSKWLLRDIVWADFKIEDGKTPVRDQGGKMARAAILLGRIITGGVSGSYELGDEWILSIDLRSGAGSDSLWRGHQFDPAVDIQDI